jgi:hypothetical protein
MANPTLIQNIACGYPGLWVLLCPGRTGVAVTSTHVNSLPGSEGSTTLTRVIIEVRLYSWLSGVSTPQASLPAGMGQYVSVDVFNDGRGEGGRAVWQNHDVDALRVNVRTEDLEKSVAESTSQHI